ncbi:MAG: hypothetical protein CMF59_06945 [Leptospiraceae bacterium]|nr:hypothetical protein [Leptospiraceae bacterium]
MKSCIYVTTSDNLSEGLSNPNPGLASGAGFEVGRKPAAATRIAVGTGPARGKLPEEYLIRPAQVLRLPTAKPVATGLTV